ncbi:hypothetical protein SteCoe_16338 [Stentor coeruleus]|uniref:Uncharacterized protein n=1 Tax=Stentor coeruleus TaxID=5963 RepID=A0A1R2C1K8_9CILI|nr:hypothetical protein SteCoe_16338 [Stentor coeruleus]
MEGMENPRIQNKLADIRETLKRIGNSLTEEDQSDTINSKYSYEEDYYKKAFNYSTPSDNDPRSEDWNSYTQNSVEIKDSPIGENDLSELKGRINEMQLNEESLVKMIKDKDKEINELKSLNYGLQNKVTSLNEIIYKKDKEISNITYEKEMGLKAFEESQILVKDLKNKENELLKENKELREVNEFAEEERKHFEKELEEAAVIIDRMKRTLMLKEETILSLNKSRSMDNEFFYASDGLKSEDYDKKNVKKIKISEKRFMNTPDKDEHGLTERSEDVSYRIICHEAMKIVGVTSTKDFYSKLLHLRQHHSRYKKSRRLIDKITDMIVQCSPSGSFSKEPNTHQIWKWITGLLEEYMKIKKSLSGEAFLKLCHILDTDDVEVMIDRVTQLVRAMSPKKKS